MAVSVRVVLDDILREEKKKHLLVTVCRTDSLRTVGRFEFDSGIMRFGSCLTTRFLGRIIPHI